MSKSVGMSVEPWIEAWPRIAITPPPGRAARVDVTAEADEPGWVRVVVADDTTHVRRVVAEMLSLDGFDIVAAVPSAVTDTPIGSTPAGAEANVAASLAMLPGTLLYVYLGSAGRAGLAAASGETGETDWLKLSFYGVGLVATVAVIGCGPIGLMLIQIALAAGASSVVATDPLPHRLAHVRSWLGKARSPRLMNPKRSMALSRFESRIWSTARARQSKK